MRPLHSHLSTVRTLILSVLCSLAFTSAHADAIRGGLPFLGLTLVSEPLVQITDRNQAVHDFGAVNSLDATQLEHTFNLRNDSETPLVITQLAPTCHCTTALITQVAGRAPDPAKESFPTLLPGQEMTVKLTVQLAHQAPGPLAHGVYLYVLGVTEPIAALHAHAKLTTGLSVTPSELDFGQMKPGESRSRSITVTFDNRLVSSAPLPPIYNQCDPRLEPKTGSLITVTPATPSAKPVPPVRVETFIVTLRPERPGDLVAHLYIAPQSPAEYKGRIPYDSAMDAFRALSVSICAQVTEN